MDQRGRYRSTPPSRTVDDMPLAAYGGTGMEDDEPEATLEAAESATAPALTADPTGTAAAAAMGIPAAVPAALSEAHPDDLTTDEPLASAKAAPPGLPGPLAGIVHLFRTSRLAAGAGFAAVIVVGLVLLSGGGASPAATAATPTGGTAQPTVQPPSGDVSMMLTGATSGSFTLTGLAGGQQVGGGAVALGWADAQQTTLSITGPLDRGTRTTDEHLVLTLGVVVAGQPVTFTSMAGECTIGMAQVGLKVQGSFTCHKLAGPDGKLTIEASGTYRS